MAENKANNSPDAPQEPVENAPETIDSNDEKVTYERRIYNILSSNGYALNKSVSLENARVFINYNGLAKPGKGRKRPVLTALEQSIVSLGFETDKIDYGDDFSKYFEDAKIIYESENREEELSRNIYNLAFDLKVNDLVLLPAIKYSKKDDKKSYGEEIEYYLGRVSDRWMYNLENFDGKHTNTRPVYEWYLIGTSKSIEESEGDERRKFLLINRFVKNEVESLRKWKTYIREIKNANISQFLKEFYNQEILDIGSGEEEPYPLD